MRRGTAIVIAAAAAAVTGCAAGNRQIEVRALADPAAKLGVGSERVIEARGQLALGNVGLAIEGFHAALREQPDNIDAMKGLAACYDSMGRTDLSRQYYEAALAVAPRNPAVLNAFAASVDAQGDRAQALELRSEAAQASAPTIRLAATPEIAEVGSSVTIALPPARPVAALAPVQLQAPATVRARVDGPRLQRLSLGEVALLTAGEPAWQAKTIARTAQSTTVRWVALEQSSAQPNIRIFNAARVQGLAARTRDYLLQRGWRKIEIGDADDVRAVSLVMAPDGREGTARSLAAQFVFRPGILRQGDTIVMLLGRDAVAGRAPQARG